MFEPSRRQLLSLAAAGALLPAGRALAVPDLPREVRRITVAGKYQVWTERVGTGATKVLLLHGGPGFSHDYMDCFADFLPQAGYELYFYDQLGCGQSDRPDDTSLWTLPRYLDEVEEVRAGLGLDRFVLVGHSWGGILGIEYALRHPERLSGFVLSSMTASFADFAAYTGQLKQALPAPIRRQLAALEAAGEQGGEAYGKILQDELYTRYICRLKPWPAPLTHSFEVANGTIYNQMQGPNEFVVTGNLRNWDRWHDLPNLQVPTLVMGARYDEMNPKSIEREARLIPGAELFLSKTGSHLTMWDDQRAYFDAILRFLAKLRR
ncbi:proline iminopeptidase-family hydrolase [Sphingomonas trueperi]|uniref:proline iminopeptidase-family hydrolase n=1 Tax=Sphingomonas trueperi TaxID=53317 RepID=UPI000EB0A95A